MGMRQGRMPLGGWIAMAVGVTCLWVMLFDEVGAEQGGRISVQTCDTECQEAMTDCVLACEQEVSCVHGCKDAAVTCTRECADGGRLRPSPRASSSAAPSASAAVRDGGAPRGPARPGASAPARAPAPRNRK